MARYGITCYWIDEGGNTARTRLHFSYLNLSQPPIVNPIQGVSGASLYAVNSWATIPLQPQGAAEEVSLGTIVVVYQNAVIRLVVAEWMLYDAPDYSPEFIEQILDALEPIATAIQAGELVAIL